MNIHSVAIFEFNQAPGFRPILQIMFLSLAGKFEDSLSRLSELFPSDIPMTSRRREKEVVSEPKVTEKPEAGWVATTTRVWAKRKTFWES